MNNINDLYYRYNLWWERDYNFKAFNERKAILKTLLSQLDNKQIIFLTGLRRIGKTTLLKLLIEQLINKKEIEPKYIFYISLDDYLLLKKPLAEIVDDYRKLHNIKFNEKIYLFFDEITYKEDYEIQLKNLYDLQNVKIYASSSSASLLKSRKAYLSGRAFTIEILPLDFDEYMQFRNIKLSKSDSHLFDNYFESYLRTGGIPEYVINGEIAYVQELVDDIIYKDIAAVNNIKNLQLLKDYFLLLMERAGKVISINKIASILSISVDTAKRYLDFFSNTFLIYQVGRHGKTNEQILSPKKLYAADTGIRTLFTGFRDKGSLFENYVFLRIKKYKPGYIIENSIEIDFFLENKYLLEVKYHNEELSDKQQTLFNKLKANKKYIIRNFDDLSKIDF